LTKSQVKIECFDADLRFYDESGEFTYSGITGKSGIGGGIVYFLKSLW
jgi:glutaminase